MYTSPIPHSCSCVVVVSDVTNRYFAFSLKFKQQDFSDFIVKDTYQLFNLELTSSHIKYCTFKSFIFIFLKTAWLPDPTRMMRYIFLFINCCQKLLVTFGSEIFCNFNKILLNLCFYFLITFIFIKT